MYALIVDDSRAIRHILRKIIEPLGFQVLEAAHGIEGLERLNEHPDIGLALVDWNMPEMNGLEFTQAVRANPIFEKLKLVMITSETDPSKVAQALMAGVDEFLMKPFMSEMLLAKLQLIGVSLPSAA